MGEDKKRNSFKEFFKMGEVAGYFFRKKDPSRPSNFNLKAMHTINKISILMFLVCMVILFVRYVL
ncbi:DUF6728 family protein [Mangrovivirga cuniculi]|uniref:Uncharacterized protein n=1 Tax=Mangrovivirga cuniculi TaxID=2715131 RepID=A0A4D7JV49_9BACT|nr:DUF6728 family protein [Mangrovivirga cuniculi]QCK16056.1 hypothetical protein DCC35_15565 [Mangrovivirga cuniculi]